MTKLILILLFLSACGSESSVDVHQQVGDDNDTTCTTCQGAQSCEDLGCFNPQTTGEDPDVEPASDESEESDSL